MKGNHWVATSVPGNTGHWSNAGLSLAKRLRRWASVKTELGQCPCFAGMLSRVNKNVTLCSSKPEAIEVPFIIYTSNTLAILLISQLFTCCQIYGRNVFLSFTDF